MKILNGPLRGPGSLPPRLHEIATEHNLPAGLHATATEHNRENGSL
jgi:hypothetical protein